MSDKETKTVTIRRSLITNLAAVVVFFGIAIVLMMALSTRRVIRNMSVSLMHQASQRTELKLRTFFEPVTNQVDSLRAWGESGELEITEVDRLTMVFQELLREFPHASSVFVANPQNREVFVRRQSGGWTMREMRPEWGDRAVIREWSDDDPTGITREEDVTYRASERPWFVGAMNQLAATTEAESEDFVFWTSPYTFFTTGKPGITASAAYHSPDGELHVVGMDVALADISRFTSALRVIGEGGVFVLTEDGRIVGVPHAPDEDRTEAEIEAMILKRPEELGTSVARDASRNLLGSKDKWDRAVRIVSDGEPWWGRVSPYRLSPSQRLLIGVSIPEKDLLDDIEEQRLWVLAITLIVLGLAILRTTSLARRYSRPIEKLVDESNRISTGDLEPGPPIKSRVAEVKQLAVAHDSMRRGLRTLMKLEGDLQVARDIQRRTFPERLPTLDGFEIAAWNEAADETGGDSYDVIGLKTSADGGNPTVTQDGADRAVLLLADATGHGIGPALSVTQLRAMLRMAVRLHPETGNIIEQINHQVWSDLPTERFITAWLGLLDSKGHSLSAFSAAQAPLILYRAKDDKCEVLGSNSVALGMFPKMKIKLPDPIWMGKGDIYAAISDGIFEANSADGEEMGENRVCEVIRRFQQETAEEIIGHIRTATDSFTDGAPPDDDRTIILVKRI